ncbi:sciellin isoform X2 [Megalops cyprinoides]|uniref:sciellin isoform X2 n=1 Tax=Megalops cyprinoides TaxID=118141 RepID=UPI001863AC0A|nr:sciellin isoform X2 [Megalops cyprinoides]
MSYSYTKRSYVPKTEVKSGSPSQAIEENKRRSTLLKDSSWIRRDAEEDEPVDRDPNFGRVVLNRFKSQENLDSKPSEKDTSSTGSSNTSVQALTKRFSGSQDQLSKTSSAPPPYERATAYSKRTTTSIKTDDPKISSVSKTTVTDGTKTTITSETTVDGKTTETSVTTTSSPTRTPVTKRPTKTETFTERVFSDVKSTPKVKPTTLPPKPLKTNGETTPEVTSSKGTTSVSSTKTITTEETKVTPTKEAAKDSDTSKTVTTVTSPSSTITTTTRTSFTTYSNSKDAPPAKVTSESISIEPSYNYKEESRTHSSYSSKPSDSSYEITSVSSPTVYTKTSYKEIRPEDALADTLISKPIKTVYSTPDRSIIGKDMCTYCRKPMNIEPKMILDELQIHCHASCFKCEVCNSSLGHLKAGDSMWIYRRTVHCENCFGITRAKWRR